MPEYRLLRLDRVGARTDPAEFFAASDEVAIGCALTLSTPAGGELWRGEVLIALVARQSRLAPAARPPRPR